MTGPALTAWAVEALVASALLMALVLALRGPVRRAFGPRIAYALWALPALRLMLPPLPAEWTQAAALPLVRASEAMTVLIVPADADAAAEPMAAMAALPWGEMLLAGWALGAAMFFAAHWLRHRRFCRQVLAGANQVAEIDGVRVVESTAAAGPLAFGTGLGGRRFVAFPRDFADRYDADERALALAHELGHHQRGDLLANWAALAVLALHWFDPIAWRAFRAFRCDQELATDARVLAGRGRVERHAYACAIIKAAHGHAVSPACHLHTIADLKGRLRMLKTTEPSRRRIAAGTTAIAGLVAAGLTLTASGTRAAAAVRERIGDAVGVELRAPAAPVLPAAPAAMVAPAAAPAAVASPRRIKRITVVNDGKTTTYEGAAADAYVAEHPLPIPPVPPLLDTLGVPPLPPAPPLGAGQVLTGPDGKTMRVFTRRNWPRVTMVAPPAVMSRTCRDGEGGGPRQLVLNRVKGGNRFIVVCRNRIHAVAAEGTAMAANSGALERDALRSAAEGLRSARAGILSDRSMSEDARRRTLEAIERGLAEVQDQRDGG